MTDEHGPPTIPEDKPSRFRLRFPSPALLFILSLFIMDIVGMLWSIILPAIHQRRGLSEQPQTVPRRNTTQGTPVDGIPRVFVAEDQIDRFKTGLDKFKLQTGRYPTPEEDLDALIRPPVGLADADPTEWPMIEAKSVPPDPWGSAYQYESPGSHNPHGYDIWSFGPDGVDDSGDEIGNWGRVPGTP